MITWLLIWLNVSVAKLNATLQLLEREREAFVSGKIEIMHGIREGMTFYSMRIRIRRVKNRGR